MVKESLWKKNEVADYEATTFSIFYNNTLFLVLVIVASFFILEELQPHSELHFVHKCFLRPHRPPVYWLLCRLPQLCQPLLPTAPTLYLWVARDVEK